MIRQILFFIALGSFYLLSANAQTIEKAAIISVSASSWETLDDGGFGNFLPEYVIDGDLSDASSFRTEGLGEWIMFDLGETLNLAHLKILFFKGSERQYTFDVEVTADTSGTWNKILDHEESGGTTTSFETFNLNATGRFVRISGYGNTNASFPDWINIIEVEIYKTVNTTSINDISSDVLACNIFPNPCSTNQLMIDLTNMNVIGDVQLQISDIGGRNIKSLVPIFQHNTIILENINLDNGIYILNVKKEGQLIQKKLIISK